MLKGAAYGNNAYGKAALGYLAAKDLLGDAEFRKCLHAFMDRWHGKHPIPWDFFNTFNDVAARDLNWFWNSWYFTNGYIDMGVESVTRNSAGYSVVINNIGGMPAPVDVRVRYSDGSTDVRHQTPAIWESDQRRATVAVATRKTLQSLQLDGGIWLDADSTNNRWTAPGQWHVLRNRPGLDGDDTDLGSLPSRSHGADRIPLPFRHRLNGEAAASLEQLHRLQSAKLAQVTERQKGVEPLARAYVDHVPDGTCLGTARIKVLVTRLPGCKIGIRLAHDFGGSHNSRRLGTGVVE